MVSRWGVVKLEGNTRRLGFIEAALPGSVLPRISKRHGQRIRESIGQRTIDECYRSRRRSVSGNRKRRESEYNDDTSDGEKNERRYKIIKKNCRLRESSSSSSDDNNNVSPDRGNEQGGAMDGRDGDMDAEEQAFSRYGEGGRWIRQGVGEEDVADIAYAGSRLESICARMQRGPGEIRAAFVAGAGSIPMRRRIVHDVVEFPEARRAYCVDEIIPRLVECRHRGGILCVAVHGTHLHVIHDCSWTSSQCRCRNIQALAECYVQEEKETRSRDGGQRFGFVGVRESGAEEPTTSGGDNDNEEEQEAEEELEKARRYGRGNGRERRIVGRRPRRRFSRRTFVAALWTTDHFENLADYLSRDGRWIGYFEYAGRSWINGAEIGDISVWKNRESAEGDVVEERELPVDHRDFIEELEASEIGESSARSDHASDIKNRGCGKGKAAKLSEFMASIIVTPLSAIFYTGFWVNSDYKYWEKNGTLIRNVMHNIAQNIVDMSVEELFDYIRKIPLNRQIFAGPWKDPWTYYYGIKKSIRVLEKLLAYQCGGETRKIKEFLRVLYQWLSRAVPKKNAIFVLSPANAGKNYFFDAVVSATIIHGNIANFNKYNSFPLQDAVNKRSLLWNEPNFEPGAIETLKMLFGGDAMAARIKYSPDAIIQRTPIVILSNNNCIPDTDAFRSRIWRYEWRSAPWLKRVSRKPHPTAIYYLLIKHGIMECNTLADYEIKFIQ